MVVCTYEEDIVVMGSKYVIFELVFSVKTLLPLSEAVFGWAGIPSLRFVDSLVAMEIGSGTECL